MKEFNKRIDDLVKFAISAKQLAVQYPNDIKNDLFSNKTKESV
jgi:hypothetical protein